MMGSYGPGTHTFKFPTSDKMPSGMLARGKYKAKIKVYCYVLVASFVSETLKYPNKWTLVCG